MFNSFFKKNNSEGANGASAMGLIKENPILLYSIASSYVYLDALCTIASGLEYTRIGPVAVVGFPRVVDRYSFSFKGKPFCDLYIYAYHSANLFVIPEPFKKLDPAINESIFDLNRSGRYRYLRTITEMVLTKNGILQFASEGWLEEDNHVLSKLKKDLGYEDELEKLILDEYKEIKGHQSDLKKIDFINYFVGEFHNKKLVRYVPEYIQERNEKILNAYHALLETINRIQAWQDNDLIRKRVEFDTLNKATNILGYSEINTCISPFCYLSLGCDVFGRFQLAYGIDYRISNMISDQMANTFIRRVYEFTPGELENFVGFASLHMDCITYFEDSLQKVDNDVCRQIEVKRNEEKSIADMLMNLELNDDLDEETKKWYRR